MGMKDVAQIADDLTPEVMSNATETMSVDEMCRVIEQAKNRITYLERELDATRQAQKHTFELYAAARDGMFNFKCADTDSQFLRDAAAKIDCGPGCRYDSYDASCNAHECSRMETAEGCDAWLATQLIELAAAFDAKRAVNAAVQAERDERPASPVGASGSEGDGPNG